MTQQNEKIMNKYHHYPSLMIPITLILLGIATRLLPHPPNFAPIGAIALFGALYLPKRFALVIPLLSLVASDLVIGFYSWPIMLSVYSGFIVMGIIGFWIRKNQTLARLVAGTLLGSIFFFLMTNWAVWAFGTMYPHTLPGLAQSYTMALPFFRNSLLGDLFYTTILVGSAAWLYRHKQQKELMLAPESHH